MSYNAFTNKLCVYICYAFYYKLDTFTGGGCNHLRNHPAHLVSYKGKGVATVTDVGGGPAGELQSKVKMTSHQLSLYKAVGSLLTDFSVH